jgi:methyl coenzyme M reductase subunit C-like uncharacterized protein (methanogenesis marker protein 7)
MDVMSRHHYTPQSACSICNEQRRRGPKFIIIMLKRARRVLRCSVYHSIHYTVQNPCK